MRVNYGLEMRNKWGMIIIDDEHPLPKLYHTGTMELSNLGQDPLGFDIRYNILSIPPTSKPIFATTSGGYVRYIELRRNAQGQFTGIYVAGDRRYNPTITVWVYEL